MTRLRSSAVPIFEGRGPDGIQEDQTRRLQPAGDGRSRDDRAERVAEDHGTGGDCRREVFEPSCVLVEVVRTSGQRSRLSESGKVRSDHAHLGKIGEHRLEAMVLTAEPVHRDHRRLGVIRSVHPVGRDRPAHLDLVTLHGKATKTVRIRGRHGHPLSLRVAVRLLLNVSGPP
jgi:hypothetical protein